LIFWFVNSFTQRYQEATGGSPSLPAQARRGGRNPHKEMDLMPLLKNRDAEFTQRHDGGAGLTFHSHFALLV